MSGFLYMFLALSVHVRSFNLSASFSRCTWKYLPIWYLQNIKLCKLTDPPPLHLCPKNLNRLVPGNLNARRFVWLEDSLICRSDKNVCQSDRQTDRHNRAICNVNTDINKTDTVLRLEVTTAVLLKIQVSLDVTPCRLVNTSSYRRFGRE